MQVQLEERLRLIPEALSSYEHELEQMQRSVRDFQEGVDEVKEFLEGHSRLFQERDEQWALRLSDQASQYQQGLDKALDAIKEGLQQRDEEWARQLSEQGTQFQQGLDRALDGIEKSLGSLVEIARRGFFDRLLGR